MLRTSKQLPVESMIPPLFPIHFVTHLSHIGEVLHVVQRCTAVSCVSLHRMHVLFVAVFMVLRRCAPLLDVVVFGIA